MNFIGIVTKSVILFVVVFFMYLLYSILIGNLEHPERELLGLWDEVEWTYEKVDRSRGSSSVQKEALKDRLKNQITADLFIHKSETWEFKEDGVLNLVKKDGTRERLKWYMKGRGHILKIKHRSGALEFYQIRELKDDKMILHFENDIHARGIVKIVFKKIKDY